MTQTDNSQGGFNAASIKSLRLSLDLSLEAMAASLGLSLQVLEAIEADKQPISSSVATIASYLIIPTLLKQQGFPQFTLGDDARVDDKHGYDYVYHNWFPRFIGIITPSDNLEDDATHITINEAESMVVVSWIDSPMHVPYEMLEDVLITGADQLKAYYEDIDLKLGG